MSAVENWSDGPRRCRSGDAVLRHPNGSIDIGAYAAIAHRQRAAAIASSMLSAVRFVRDAGAAITARCAHKQAAAQTPRLISGDGRRLRGIVRAEAAENSQCQNPPSSLVLTLSAANQDAWLLEEERAVRSCEESLFAAGDITRGSAWPREQDRKQIENYEKRVHRTVARWRAIKFTPALCLNCPSQ